jgi:hypothetical protein
MKTRTLWWLALPLMMLGAGIVLVVQLYTSSITPQEISITGIQLTNLPDGGWLLRVHIETPKPGWCARISQHTIFRGPDDDRDYVPLASGLAGIGFNVAEKNVGANILLKIHPGTPKGLWYYQNRSAYICVAFPGIMRLREVASHPEPVELR